MATGILIAGSNPTFPLLGGILPIRLVVQTNSNKHIAYLNSIQRDSVITLARLASMFESFTNGSLRSNIDINTNGIYATNLITFSSFVNNDTITVNSLVLTGKTAAASNIQFTIGATDSGTATNAAAAINAHPTLFGTVFAVASAATVQLTCRIPGLIGNLCLLAISAHGSVTGANFANGADGTQSNNAHGL